MAVGRQERLAALRPRIVEVFGGDPTTLTRVEQVIALMEMAWHDCYGEVSPPDDVVASVLTCSGGTLAGLIDAAHLAVTDRRDLAVRASAAE